MPQITVIIPAYRRREYLFEALDRVFAQKDVRLEVLVFSEVMGPDEVDEVQTAYPQVTYVKTDRYCGASEKRRAGIRMAKGDYLYMPDDDDYLTDDTFLRRALDILEHDPSLSMVAGDTIISYEYADKSRNHEERRELRLEGRLRGVDYLQEVQVTMSKPMSSVSTLFRKQVFIDRGLDAMYEISDVCMYMNALLWGDMVMLPEVVAVYRFHEKNLTYHLSHRFMMNVLREKHRIYLDARKRLPRPADFWYHHFRITYFFYRDGSATFMGKIKMLLWGLGHLHGNCRMISLIFKEFVKNKSIERSKTTNCLDRLG